MGNTAADEAYREIKQKIVKVEMQPGSVIREAELMQQLNLGRTPIREALQRLEAENLVEVTPRQGMFVADIAITDLTQIFEVRVELEALCASLAALRIKPHQLEALEKLVEEYQAFKFSNLDDLFEIDQRFHASLAQAANNRFLQAEMDGYYNLSLRIWYVALNSVKPDDVDVDAHVQIFKAVKARNPEKAEKCMRAHIQHFHQTVKQYL
jgi:DNA-binding GntR family transcriptional regulator